MEQLERLFKVLADKNRIRILKLLDEKPMCVCELAFVLGITQPSVSRHLKKLKAAGFIGDEQEGFWTNYFLNKAAAPCARALMASLRRWLNDDVLIKSDRKKSQHIDREKLCCRVDSNKRRKRP